VFGLNKRQGISYRDWRFRLAILIFGSALLYGMFTRETHVVSRSHESGTVQSVLAQVGVVELKDGRRVRVMFAPPVPKEGDKIPLIVERFRDGKERYYLDQDRWQTKSAE
jgi:hypothetical protein